jgi:4-diphosphocytidyl-2-C-methyl-D-erythritol kinase
MKEFAPAKINLFLDVIRKREDGYHDLGTVFQTVDVGDTLEFSSRDDGEIHLEYSNPQEYPVESDLVYKAAVALRSHVGNNDLGADIFLDKIMPLGAGLGGGSADAAAALRALNRLWELRLPPAELERIGAKLGADVPFLVRGGTAFAEGIGEQLSFLEPLDLPAGKVLLIATPHDSVPTKDAYAGVPKSGPNRWENYKESCVGNKAAREAFILDPKSLFNAFEVSVFPKHPLVASMKEKFLDLGAEAALMSGSGASVFGIFADRSSAQSAAEALQPYSRYLALTKFWHT